MGGDDSNLVVALRQASLFSRWLPLPVGSFLAQPHASVSLPEQLPPLIRLARRLRASDLYAAFLFVLATITDD
jgi:hypothetical protein